MRLSSAIDPRSDAFRANAAAMAVLVADLKVQAEAASLGGGKESRARHVSRGKLLPRDRIEALGGHIEIESRKTGTRLDASFPTSNGSHG